MANLRSRLVECKNNINISKEQIEQYAKANNVVDKDFLRHLYEKLDTVDINASLSALDVTAQIVSECKILLRKEQQRRQLFNELSIAYNKGKLKREKRDALMAAEFSLPTTSENMDGTEV